jgi:hypothetical protein
VRIATFFDLEIEQQLIRVEAFAEIPKRRPLQAAFGRLSPVALELQAAFLRRDVQFVVVRIEQFDAVLRAFGERHAMPDLLARSVLARIPSSRPARDLELGPPRRQSRIVQAVFDLLQFWPPSDMDQWNR